MIKSFVPIVWILHATVYYLRAAAVCAVEKRKSMTFETQPSLLQYHHQRPDWAPLVQAEHAAYWFPNITASHSAFWAHNIRSTQAEFTFVLFSAACLSCGSLPNPLSVKNDNQWLFLIGSFTAYTDLKLKTAYLKGRQNKSFAKHLRKQDFHIKAQIPVA